MDEQTSLWNTKLNDLTVGQSAKLVLGTVAIAVAIPTSKAVIGTVKNKFSTWKHQRALNKTEKDLEIIRTH